MIYRFADFMLLFCGALALFVLATTGCGPTQLEKDYAAHTGNSPNTQGWRVEVFDSCEYVINNRHNHTHKGNCRFCKERNKK